MDDFTQRHLANWIDRNVYPEEQAQFHAYATRAVNDDPEFDWNWPSLWRLYLNSKV